MIQYREVRLQHYYYRRKSSPFLVKEGDHLLKANGSVVNIVCFDVDHDSGLCLVEGARFQREQIPIRHLLLPYGVRATAAINTSRRSNILIRQTLAGGRSS